MTDREMLELAAKAAGLEITGWPQEDYATVRDGDGDSFGWSPLIFDSDALRLAVKLHMSIEHSLSWSQAGTFAHGWREPVNHDQYAATRYAIVRTAAEIGKAMP